MEEAIRSAASRGAKQRLLEILESGLADDVDGGDAERTTALMFACLNGFTDCVNLLLKFGADVERRRQTGSKPLFLAAQGGHCDVVRILLNAGSDINAQNNNGATALLVASQLGHVNVVELLCSCGADVGLAMNDQTTPVFAAAENGHVEVIRVLFRWMADIDAVRTDGTSPLWIASQTGSDDVVAALLHMGAVVDRSRGGSGITPLFKAAGKGNVGVVNLLLAKRPSVGLQKCGYAPIHVAAYCGHLAVVQALLEHGSDPDGKAKDGLDPAELAALNGFDSVSKLIMIQQAATF